MNEQKTFYRKIVYLVAIAILLFPISQLGAPETVEDEGGKLAQLRRDYNLGQSELGEIDPASETIRLATLGLRGIAVSMLCTKANDYKKKEDWTNFRATLQQLSKLQPYVISFWRYQAWNLSYNVSVELDDVRDRYYYVRRGIEFLQDGTKYNRNNPYLLSELGWFIGSKIGTADEKAEYRRMFKADDDYHPADRPREQRDNWLVAKGWYEQSVSAVDDSKQSMGQKNPTIFYAAPAMSQINYSEAIQREGTFGEKAKNSWATAHQMWNAFGQREMRASDGTLIRLGSYEQWEKEGQELQQQLDTLVTGARDELEAKRRAELSESERALLDKPVDNLTDDEAHEYGHLLKKMEITPEDLAEYVAETHPEQAIEARKLAHRLLENMQRVRLTRSNRDVSNFAYWATRCEVEQMPEALKARELAYAAKQAFQDDADLVTARKMYEQSFDLWAKVFQAHPELELDSPSASDIMDDVELYAKVLEQLDLSLEDEEINRQFPLWDMVESNNIAAEYSEAILLNRRLNGTAKPAAVPQLPSLP